MDKKKLQLALNYTSSIEALAMLNQVGRYVDVIEIGAALIASEGIQAVETIQQAWPDKEIVISGIRLESFGATLNSAAGMVISAEGICDSADPRATAQLMRKALDAYNAANLAA